MDTAMGSFSTRSVTLGVEVGGSDLDANQHESARKCLVEDVEWGMAYWEW